MSASSKSNYFAQLDAFRGIAVIFVLIHHLIPHSPDYLAWGPLGVRLFFVLSGFLITGILLDRRESSQSRLATWGQFYYRRALRIFPIYFLSIGILALLDVHPVRETIGWLFTFTINFYMGLKGEWAGCVSHFWFLSVGEQFYLAWTLVLLFFPRRWIPPLTILLILLAPLVRTFASICWGWREMMVWYSPLSSMDSLCLGSLIGWLHRDHREKTTAWMQQEWIGKTAIALLVLSALIRWKFNDLPLIHWVETIEAFGFAWVIYRAAVGFDGSMGKILLSKPLVFTGMISYGVYLYHPMVHGVVLWGFPKIGLPDSTSSITVIATTVALTYLLSILSWNAIENPIGNLKKKK